VLAAIDHFQVVAVVNPDAALILAGMINNYCHDVLAEYADAELPFEKDPEDVPDSPSLPQPA
jgi:hypothetical protein